MNVFRMIMPLVAAFAVVTGFLAYQVDAFTQGEKISTMGKGNKHNLSSDPLNIGLTYQATDEYDAISNPSPRGRQVCIFCHTPHSANVDGGAPLWNRKFSTVTFQRYTSATLNINIRHIATAQYGDGAQPNGASKLCLSCHDGVSNLGDVYNSGGVNIPFDVGKDLIAGLASFNPSTYKMLSGHHPVSFVYLTGFSYGSQSGTPLAGLPASYRFLPASSAGKVKLFDTKRNGNGWMQCTTCHDPHQNQSDETACFDSGGGVVVCGTETRKVAPFWVYHGGINTTATDDTGSVCKVCHALGASSATWRP